MATAVESLGHWLQAHQHVVRRIQWSFVLIYLVLLVGPVLLPPAAPGARVFDSLARFAELLFWGIWWPGVILATMLFGQLWCGVFCPDGVLTETASRLGRGGRIPAALRRRGWPLLLFALLSVAEQQSDAHRSAQLTLAFVGGSSLLAVLTGLAWGRGKRVWCRYLCPAGGVFSLLARCAVVHVRVDRVAWDAAARPLPRAVDCPLLLDVRRLRSNEKCNMCGRCVGHRQAVTMALRRPGDEIVGLDTGAARAGEAAAIVFLLVGLAVALRYGSASPLPVRWPALASLLLSALVVGGTTTLILLVAWLGSLKRSVGLAWCLIPFGGMLMLLAGLEYGLAIALREGLATGAWRDGLRLILPPLGALWSSALAADQLRAGGISTARRGAALMLFAGGVTALAAVASMP